jgi:hypothetical protein
MPKRSVLCAGGCGKLVEPGRGSSEQVTCRACRREQMKRTCQRCNREFQARVKDSPNHPNKFCSQECAGNAKIYDDPRAASKASTRARKAGRRNTWDGVTDWQILDRDDWLCQIPGCELGPIRADLAHPDPLSPSVDHIIPITRAAPDFPVDAQENKRAAHLICNLRRGNALAEGGPRVRRTVLVPERLREKCPVHGPRKSADLPWPKRVYWRPCRWCGVLTMCARSSKSPWTVCQPCSHGKCIGCGADMVIVVNSRPPERRLCQQCTRGPVNPGAKAGTAARTLPVADGTAARTLLAADGTEDPLWWTKVRPVPVADGKKGPLWWTTVRPG